MSRRYLTTGQVAKAMGLTDRSVRRAAESGRIDGAVRAPGGHWRIPVEWLEGLMESIRPVVRRVTATATTAVTAMFCK